MGTGLIIISYRVHTVYNAFDRIPLHFKISEIQYLRGLTRIIPVRYLTLDNTREAKHARPDNHS